MKSSGAKLSIAFLYDDTLDSSDGVAQYVKRLGKFYSQQGHSVSYLVGQTKINNWSGGRVYSLARNLKVSWGGNRLSISLFPKLNRITKVLADNDFDIIHVQVPYSPFMAQPVINRSGEKTVVVGTVHVFPANKLAILGSKILKVIYGRSLKRFDHIASVSRAAQSYAKEAFGLETVISPNIVDLSEFETKESQSAAERKIVFLGRLVERKGVQYLIQAFAGIAADHTDVKLVIAGDGVQRDKLEGLVKKHNLKDQIDFLGYASEEQKVQVLSGAEIACFPSLYGESFGIVLIEAMAAGAGVVVGGDNPGYRTVLEATPQALVNPKDVDSFSKSLMDFLDNPKLAKKIHTIQQAEVAKYDIHKVGSEWLKLYLQLIAKRRSKRHN